jgi:hypothetical protein
MKKITLLFLLAPFLFISCLDLEGFSSNKTPEKGVEFKTVKIDNRYKIKLPSYMKETSDLNDDASLQYMNVYKETYFIIIDESKDDIISTFKELGEYNDSISVAENYKTIQLNSLKESVNDLKTYNEKRLKINGLNSVLIQGDGTVENFKASYFLGYIEGKETVYMLFGWTEQKAKKKYGNTFLRILKSFSEIR